MAETKGAKASKARKAKAAKAEAENTPKQVKWHGLALELPDEMSGDLLFAFYDFEEQQRNEEMRFGPMLSLVRSLVGEKQFLAVRRKVGEEKLSIEAASEALSELLDGLLKQYGMGLGES